MGKFALVLKDQPDGSTTCQVRFSPGLTDQTDSVAQRLGLELLKFLEELGAEQEYLTSREENGSIED